MWNEIITGTLKMWWAIIPFIVVMITAAVWEAKDEK